MKVIEGATVIEQVAIELSGLKTLAVKTDDGELFLKVKDITTFLELNGGKHQAELKRLQSDPLLQQATTLIKVQTNGGAQNAIHINSNYLAVWLSSINRKSFNNEGYAKLIILLNGILEGEFNHLKYPQKIYQWESELRDEIFLIGYFDTYKIIAKEECFSFGRVDLLALDESGQTIVVELKKHKNYNDTIAQCHKYVDGFSREFSKNIKVVICTLDEDKTFLEEAARCGFEVYSYKRELKVTRR